MVPMEIKHCWKGDIAERFVVKTRFANTRQFDHPSLGGGKRNFLHCTGHCLSCVRVQCKQLAF